MSEKTTTSPETNLHSAMSTVDYLNNLLERDRNAIECLFDVRVPCEENLAMHPTCQVVAAPNGSRVGFLGVINGLFGVDEKERGHICGVFDDEDNLLKFALTRDVCL